MDLGCPQPDEADREGGERGEGHTCGAGDKDLMDSHLSHPKWFYQRMPLQSGYYIMRSNPLKLVLLCIVQKYRHSIFISFPVFFLCFMLLLL